MGFGRAGLRLSRFAAQAQAGPGGDRAFRRTEKLTRFPLSVAAIEGVESPPVSVKVKRRVGGVVEDNFRGEFGSHAP